MDVKQIQYFSLVSSTGSFNAAAKQLYISVPGLVKAMDRLENELGVQLFVRRRSGVTLTPAGQALARYAPRYIRKYEMIVSNVRKAAAQREMRAEVCMTWGMLSFFPRNFLSRFVLSNPDMSLSTHNYSLQELEEALRGCKVILVNSDPEVMRQLQNRLESVGCPPQIMLDGAEWEQAVELIQSAGYISFCLPPGNLSNARLQTREIEDLGLTLDFNMAVMRGVAMTDAERRFVEYVVQMMTANHGGDEAKKR